MDMSERRKEKLHTVAAFRQKMTVVLENVHDPHNIGAVLRTCDAVGIQEVFIIYTDERLDAQRLNNIKVSSTGVRKWMDIHIFHSVEECMNRVTQHYDYMVATHLDAESKSLYSLDLSKSFALLLGNEHEGLTPEILTYADVNIVIPQFGMVQSLNISVACAVILYEASRQRQSNDMYQSTISTDDQWRRNIFNNFIERHKTQ